MVSKRKKKKKNFKIATVADIARKEAKLLENVKVTF